MPRRILLVPRAKSHSRTRPGWLCLQVKRMFRHAAVIFAAYALATANASDRTASQQPSDEVCVDAHVGKTFGGDVAGCREYLAACLSDLTEAQRAEWHRSVDSC